MKQRCDNPNRDDYKYYGALGVTYCPEWADATTFANEMVKDWLPNKVLDRIDRTKPYSRANCRWTDWPTSNYNRKIFTNNRAGIAGVGFKDGRFRARAGINGVIALYHGPDFFEACCARKSWEVRQRPAA
jgi:hypothetical protein